MKTVSCYPNGTNLCEQIKKIEEEFEEVLESYNNDEKDWEDLCQEILDLQQTCTSAIDIILDEQCRNNANIKYELFDRMLEMHQQKQSERRKEWCGDNGGD